MTRSKKIKNKKINRNVIFVHAIDNSCITLFNSGLRKLISARGCVALGFSPNVDYTFPRGCKRHFLPPQMSTYISTSHQSFHVCKSQSQLGRPLVYMSEAVTDILLSADQHLVAWRLSFR